MFVLGNASFTAIPDADEAICHRFPFLQLEAVALMLWVVTRSAGGITYCSSGGGSGLDLGFTTGETANRTKEETRS